LSSADRLALLLAAGFLAAALHGLGDADIVGDDEAREAGLVQEIVAGHWLLPRFNGDTLPDKPPLYHWLAALPCGAAGFSEAAVRLPSALAGAVLVGWTASFGTELGGPRVGVAAAVMLGTMPALFDHSRVARPDVLVTLLLSIALGLAFRWWRDESRAAATGALAVLGLATLAKGPVAPALFGMTVLGFLWWQRSLGRLPHLFTPASVFVALGLGLGWYGVALAGWGAAFVREHLVGRYLGNLVGGFGTVDYTPAPRPLAYHLTFYPTHLLTSALPWTPFTAAALWRLGRAGGFRDARARFLFCWAAAPVIAFTPAATKLRHYLLPSLPPLALLTAPTLVALLETPPRHLDRRGLALRVAAGILLGAAALATGRWLLGDGRTLLSRSDQSTLEALLPLLRTRPGALATAAAGFALGVAVVTARRRPWPALVGLVVAGATAWMVAGGPAVEGALARRDSLRPFARAVAARYPAPAPIAFYGRPVRAVVVYLGRHARTLDEHPDAITAGLPVIAEEEAYRKLAADHVVGAPLLSAEGRVGNRRRGRLVLAEGTVP